MNTPTLHHPLLTMRLSCASYLACIDPRGSVVTLVSASDCSSALLRPHLHYAVPLQLCTPLALQRDVHPSSFGYAPALPGRGRPATQHPRAPPQVSKDVVAGLAEALKSSTTLTVSEDGLSVKRTHVRPPTPFAGGRSQAAGRGRGSLACRWRPPCSPTNSQIVSAAGRLARRSR